VSEIRLHLDEDAEAHALVRALRGRGVDVTTTSEADLMEASDEAQLLRATREGRALLTYNAADFCRLHKQFIQEDRHHAGIIIAEQQRHSVGEMMRGVLRLTATFDAETMRDRLEFLNRWV
jgi:uncharacterized protein with PIN domain